MGHETVRKSDHWTSTKKRLTTNQQPKDDVDTADHQAGGATYPQGGPEASAEYRLRNADLCG